MNIEEDEELVQVILDGNSQNIIDIYSSRAYGWIKKCMSLYPSEIEGVVESLNLNESDSAAIIYHVLKAVLNDIDEHEEYSENNGGKDGINERLIELKKRIQSKKDYKWEYLYKLAKVVQNGHACFTLSARERMTDPVQIEYLKKFEGAESAERPEILMNTKDFSFMTTLLDEAILSKLSLSIRRGASNSNSKDDLIEAEKSFDAFKYYVSNRPLPLCFGTQIIDQAIEMAARWENKEFADKVTPYINKIIPNVNTYTSLSRFYSTYKNRDKLIESLKLAEQYGALDYNFDWSRWENNPWKNDDEVLRLIPKPISEYPLINK